MTVTQKYRPKKPKTHKYLERHSSNIMLPFNKYSVIFFFKCHSSRESKFSFSTEEKMSLYKQSQRIIMWNKKLFDKISIFSWGQMSWVWGAPSWLDYSAIQAEAPLGTQM